jgi:DNA-binding XRE family transcriptional regulator
MKNKNKIRFYRRLLDWTQDDLAKAVGCEQRTLCDYERGKIRTSENLKSKISTVLGIPEKMIFPRSEG